MGLIDWAAERWPPPNPPEPPPKPEPLVDERIAEFKLFGRVRVPARDGSGIYTITSDRSSYGGIYIPVTVYWNGPVFGSTVHPEWAPSASYGNRLVFSQSWGGDFVDAPAAVEMILHFIDAGLPIHGIQCGTWCGTVSTGTGRLMDGLV